MSNNLQEAFFSFNKDYVNLDPDRTDTAKASYDWLIKQLNGFPERIEEFPWLYEEKHVRFGSFSRKTKIRELDDIDFLLAIHGNNAWYECLIPHEEYLIHAREDSHQLKPFLDSSGNVNSRRMVNMLVRSLKSVDQYSSADIHTKKEAATLSLSSYEWNFDIVPAFYTVNNFYLIPDGNGNWKATNPPLDQAYLTRVNQKFNGKILQIVRTLKYWNKRAKVTTITPYLFEVMILDFFDSQESVTDYIDLELISFWRHLVNGIHFDVSDPKGIQGNLNNLDWELRNSISEYTSDVVRKAEAALQLEKDADVQGSIRKWAEILGPNFT